MKAIISIALLAGCAVSPVKTTQFISATPIDTKAAFATAISTVQERFAVLAVDPLHGTFATAPARADVTGPTAVSYVVRFLDYVPPYRGIGGGYIRRLDVRRSMARRIAVEVTPVAFANGEALPPDRVPRAARDTADDLVHEIRYREQVARSFTEPRLVRQHSRRL
jgi:hypothetical protein